MSARPSAGGHWRLEMRDGDRWTPVAVPVASRADAEHLLALRGGTGLTYRITHHPDTQETIR